MAESTKGKPMEIEDIELMAKEMIERDGSHIPMIIMEKADGHCKIIALAGLGDDKGKAVKAIIALAVADKAIRIFHICEAYAGNAKDKIRPRDNPNAKEVLMISEYRADNANKFRCLEFKKEDKKIIWGERQTDKDVKSWGSSWNPFLEDAVMERVNNERQK